MEAFELVSEFAPTGDQPKAIKQLVAGIEQGDRHQTLLGATGTGKTFVMANVVATVNKPTLVLAHNKTLAAQLYSEFKEFFPHNAVEYFVSYYDYYQPEAYVPQHDLYIEKETQINDQIDRLRIAATAALLTRQDVLIVASVSCIYGLGSPLTWDRVKLTLERGDSIRRDNLLRHLVRIQYNRNDLELRHGAFRVRGDTLEIMPSYGSTAIRVELWGDDIERITEFDPLTGEVLGDMAEVTIFPSRHYIAEQNTLQVSIHQIEEELEEQVKYFEQNNLLVEAQRIRQRTHYDLEMLREAGFCSGIENYSRFMDRRQPGEPPFTLLDYFPSDWLLIVDESHMTIPQVRGMYAGDQARKRMLIEHGFRLPSALDNRPLNFEEFEERIPQAIYTTATPSSYEMENSAQVVEQIIRPTGLIDPEVEVRPIEGQVDDLLEAIHNRIEKGERTLVTTLTIAMSEKLADYMQDAGLKVAYLHSQIDTLERVEILRDLRLGVYDVVVGINLLREGLDLPEVSLVAILDADKQGFLRSETALIQTIGRAARHVNGQVIMYADRISDAMQGAIDETNRRRAIQMAHNKEHGIEPQSIRKSVRDLTDRVKVETMQAAGVDVDDEDLLKPEKMPTSELVNIISQLEAEMKQAAADLEFEKAALLRDQIYEMRDVLASKETGRENVPIWEQDRILPVADENPA